MYHIIKLRFFSKTWLVKNIIVSITLFISLLLINCGNKDIALNENSISFSKFPKEEAASFKDVYEFKKGTPFKLFQIDNSLIIFSTGNIQDYFFYNYSLKNGQLSKGYLSKGRGPGEIFGSVSAGITGNTIWLHDFMLKKVVTINKNKAVSRNEKDTIFFNEYPIKNFYYSISFKDSLNYLGAGAKHSTFKIQEIDLPSGEETSEFGVFKNPPDDTDIPFYSYKSAHEGFIYTKPSGGKSVLVYRFTDAVEIYDLATKQGKSIHGPEGYKAAFKPLNADGTYLMLRTKETRFAFVNATVTNHYIYALYSGKLNESVNPSYGKYIYVYDWDGNPVKKITLDREIESLTVSEDDTMIYSYDVNTGYIVKANIN